MHNASSENLLILTFITINIFFFFCFPLKWIPFFLEFIFWGEGNLSISSALKLFSHLFPYFIGKAVRGFCLKTLPWLTELVPCPISSHSFISIEWSPSINFEHSGLWRDGSVHCKSASLSRTSHLCLPVQADRNFWMKCSLLYPTPPKFLCLFHQ